MSDITLAIATARLNARIRGRGLSAREMLFQRDQFTNSQIPISDMDLITEQHQSKLRNHKYSERSKAPLKDFRSEANVDVGDLVYLHTDKQKTKARDRYIIVNTDNDWIYVRKFVGKQLRNASYKIKRSECYKVHSNLTFQNTTYPIQDFQDPYSDQYDSNYNVTSEPVVTITPNTPNSVHNSDNILPQIPEAIVPPSHLNSSDDGLIDSVTDKLSDIPIDDDQKQLQPPVIDQFDVPVTSTNPQELYTNKRPQRNRRQPDKFSIKWDTSQSYS